MRGSSERAGENCYFALWSSQFMEKGRKHKGGKNAPKGAFLEFFFSNCIINKILIPQMCLHIIFNVL
jgi:hypothetical protein